MLSQLANNFIFPHRKFLLSSLVFNGVENGNGFGSNGGFFLLFNILPNPPVFLTQEVNQAHIQFYSTLLLNFLLSISKSLTNC